MAKYCPIVKGKVTYLFCQECDDRVCEHKPARRCKITGRLYEDVPEYSSWDVHHEFPGFRRIEGTEREWTVEGIRTINEARGWMIVHHPDFYMGSTIAFEGPGADFACAAVPCPEYERGYFETHIERYEYAKVLAEKYGVVCGESEYDEVVASARKITEEMIREGYAKGVITLGIDPNMEQGTVAAIGDYWFYFGGLEADELNPDEYAASLSEEEIAHAIFESIDELSTESPDEYRYYYSILA